MPAHFTPPQSGAAFPQAGRGFAGSQRALRIAVQRDRRYNRIQAINAGTGSPLTRRFRYGASLGSGSQVCWLQFRRHNSGYSFNHNAIINPIINSLFQYNSPFQVVSSRFR